MIKVIGFDLDDTLWAVKPIIIRAEKQLDSWLASNVPGMTHTVASMRSLRHEVLNDNPEMAHQITELRRRIIEKAISHSDINNAEQLSIQAIEVFLQARNEIEFFDGALDAIAHLAGDFVLGALSNGNADIFRLGLDPYFSFAFSAEQVGAPKPAPDLFTQALAHTQVEPDEMIYVGDDPLLDVDTANNLGLHTVWVNHRQKQPGNTTADATIDHVRDLPLAVSEVIAKHGSAV
jgi:FMN hydrolase / 5-amino-6-(5-phospho-D-ribitylamino)uracil phosphatase